MTSRSKAVSLDKEMFLAWDADGNGNGPFTMATRQTNAAGEDVSSNGTPGGCYATASYTRVAASIGAGDIINTAKELAFTYANGLAVPVGSTIRIFTTKLKLDKNAVPSGQTSFSGYVYNAAPATTGQGDNDLWVAKTADFSKYLGKLSLGTPADLGDFLFIRTSGQDFDIKLGAASSSAYMTLVTDAAHTPIDTTAWQFEAIGLVI